MHYINLHFTYLLTYIARAVKTESLSGELSTFENIHELTIFGCVVN